MDYLELNPESATLMDLLQLLYSCDNVQKINHCVRCKDHEKLRVFRHRWVIFMSIVTLKCIRGNASLMVKVGDIVELWLNLVPCNGGFKQLFFNFLRVASLVEFQVVFKPIEVIWGYEQVTTPFSGEVIMPISSHASFVTFIGHLDPRVELDKNILPNDYRYSASLSAMASKLSYENESFVKDVITNHWKMGFLGFYEFWNNRLKKHSTQAIMFYDPKADLVVVAFRGTSPFDTDDLITDFDTGLCQIDPKMGLTHFGFMSGLGLIKGKGWPKPNAVKQTPNQQLAYYTIRQNIKKFISKRKSTKVVVTGHSLGGALAILFVSVLIYHDEKWLIERLEGVYTFGQPKVGNDEFAKFMRGKMREYKVKYLRYVYSYDLVPRLPTDHVPQLFKHFGRGLYFNSLYQGKLLWEEPNKHFFTPRWAVHKYFDSIWELIRSFIMQYTEGPEYKESWLSTLLRVFGLLITGFPAHSPRNYINVTRLGSLPFNLQKLIHEEHLKYD